MRKHIYHRLPHASCKRMHTFMILKKLVNNEYIDEWLINIYVKKMKVIRPGY